MQRGSGVRGAIGWAVVSLLQCERRGGVECHGHVGGGVSECEVRGVEHEAWGVGAGVESIAEDGVAEVGEVDAELV